MLMQAIQNIATGGAILLGSTYIIGGLIVNLNLSRRGVVEYQILKVKYLAVGIIFFLQVIGVFAFAGLIAFALLNFASVVFLQFINILSMLAALSLLLVWSRYPSNTPSFLGDWKFWFITSTVGAIFPMLVLETELLVPRFYLPWGIVIVQAGMTALLTSMAMLYHYSAFYYGRPRGSGALDPIGIGIPTRVRLACEADKLHLLESLGVPIETENTTADLYLVDETDRHYIISYQMVTGEKADQTLKIDKDLVKAILYIPEHMRRLDGQLIRPRLRTKKAGK
jgi:hypothetical protein